VTTTTVAEIGRSVACARSSTVDSAALIVVPDRRGEVLAQVRVLPDLEQLINILTAYDRIVAARSSMLMTRANSISVGSITAFTSVIVANLALASPILRTVGGGASVSGC
jgi:hypothetical protein